MKFTQETLVRATRTFLQAAFAYFSVNLMNITFTDDQVTLKNTIFGFIIAGVSAGVAAVMNLEREDDSNE